MRVINFRRPIIIVIKELSVSVRKIFVIVIQYVALQDWPNSSHNDRQIRISCLPLSVMRYGLEGLYISDACLLCLTLCEHIDTLPVYSSKQLVFRLCRTLSVEQSILYVCCLCTYCWTNDIWHLTRWLTLEPSRSSSEFKVIGQSSHLQEENVTKVVGAISSEDLAAWCSHMQ